MKGDQYVLTSIGDLLLIPVESLSACLRDIEYAIQFAQLCHGEDATPEKFGPMTWTDDGNHSVYMTYSSGETLTLEVTDAEDSNG